MITKKIDDEKLRQYIRQGLSQAEIAKRFGVSRAAVSRRMSKEYDIASKRLIYSPASQEILSQKISLAKELCAVIDRNKKLLAQIDDVLDGKEDISSLDKLLSGKTSPVEALVKLQGELRKVLGLAYGIMRDLNSIKQHKEFQDTLIQILKEADPSVSKKFMDLLKARSNMGNALAAIDDEQDFMDV